MGINVYSKLGGWIVLAMLAVDQRRGAACTLKCGASAVSAGKATTDGYDYIW